MKIKIQQFLTGKNHSWAVVGKSIGRAFLNLGHSVDFFSTDGVNDSFVPDYCRPSLYNCQFNDKDSVSPSGLYDLQLSYTAMKNFPFYLKNGTKNRFGIYNYDGSVLPEHWVKYYQCVDRLLPSSEYAKKVFLDAKIPEHKLTVIPHGININDFNVEPYKLKTKKSIKILNVCGQLHRRKNIAGILEAYGKAFTAKDDVCLVLKVADAVPRAKFEVSFREIYNQWKTHNANGPEVEVIYNYINDIESLFLACDIHFSLSNIECFHIPSLQSMAAGKLTIQSNSGGNIDFMNKNNSLLVEGKTGRCPPTYQYWTPSPYAEMFIPDKSDAIDKLRYAVNNYDSLMVDFLPNMQKVIEQYTWDNVAKRIIGLND
ncbi:MAG: glycosyltransferase [bacterium]|nr:glycosyltransferase [bacterium]